MKSFRERVVVGVTADDDTGDGFRRVTPLFGVMSPRC